MPKDEDFENVLNHAAQYAEQLRHEYITLEHFLYSVCFDPVFEIFFRGFKISRPDLIKDLSSYLNEKIEKNLKHGRHPNPTIGLHRVLSNSLKKAQEFKQEHFYIEFFLLVLLDEEESYAAFSLRKRNISKRMLEKFIVDFLVPEDSKFRVEKQKDSFLQIPQNYPSVNHNPPKKKKLLDIYTVNLCEKAKEKNIDPVIGRSVEISRTMQILLRRKKNNPLYVGEAGVGKTAIVEGLALAIVKGEVPNALKNAEIFSLDIGGLISGTRYRGDFEERLNGILQELKARPKGILFIDEIHTIIGIGSVQGSNLDGSNILKPMLASGELSCIGATTHKEYREYFEKDTAMVRRFQKILVEEPSQEECFQILEGIKSHYETFHHVSFDSNIIKKAIELSQIYMRDRKLPDKAIDILDEIGARLSLSSDKHHHALISDVEHVVSQMVKIPIENFVLDQKSRLINFSKKLQSKIFGQDQAVSSLESVIFKAYSGLSSKERLMGSFLFSGPTGVGKTELAKELAHLLGVHFLRFDMSEYMEKHAISRLIGSPPGYVGHEEGGLLTEGLRKNPNSVVLLDEIEKAHPDIHHVLLQVMDYGVLTDSSGRIADFRHSFLIMTSNVGSAELTREIIGFSKFEKKDSSIHKALNQTFSPEFRNRIDKVVTFQPLCQDVMGKIANKFLLDVEEKLKVQGMNLKVSPEARVWLAQKGYDPLYGARPMSRLVDEKVREPIAKKLLFEEKKEFSLVVDGDELVLL